MGYCSVSLKRRLKEWDVVFHGEKYLVREELNEDGIFRDIYKVVNKELIPVEDTSERAKIWELVVAYEQNTPDY